MFRSNKLGKFYNLSFFSRNFSIFSKNKFHFLIPKRNLSTLTKESDGKVENSLANEDVLDLSIQINCNIFLIFRYLYFFLFIILIYFIFLFLFFQKSCSIY